ncbi:MAG: histidine kinase, partial [Oscillospiraceae bacterium]|nr:histidine kinase [Oscillospiraceae bacterium]
MRTELTKRIFAACMLVFALTIGLVMVAVNGYAAQRDAEELRSRAAYLAAGMDRGGPEDSVMQAARGVDRITLIAPDGRVLYDSEQDAARMENHASREEVHQALLSGEGSSERISETLTRKTVYFARRLENGNVLRVSMVKDSVWVLALHLVRPMTAILVIMVALSVWLASRTSKR